MTPLYALRITRWLRSQMLNGTYTTQKPASFFQWQTNMIFSLILITLSLTAVASAVVLHGGTQAKPQTICLTSRRTPRGSTFGKRALSSVNVPLADYFNGTDLQ